MNALSKQQELSMSIATLCRATEPGLAYVQPSRDEMQILATKLRFFVERELCKEAREDNLVQKVLLSLDYVEDALWTAFEVNDDYAKEEAPRRFYNDHMRFPA